MPSFSHELLVDLFRRAPPLARELLRRSAGVELPPGEDEAGSVDLSQVTSPSYSADVLILVRGERARALAAVVVEVQLNVDAQKRNSWPVYVASARREHDCPAFLLPSSSATPDSAWSPWWWGPRRCPALPRTRPRICRSWPCSPPSRVLRRKK